MAGYVACLTSIRNATGLSDMTDDEAEGMLDAVLAAKERIGRERGIAGDPALRAAAEQAAADHASAAALAKRNMLLNLQARVARRGRIAAAPDPVMGMQAEIRSVNTPLRGGRFSAEAEGKALSNEYIGGMVAELSKAGLFKAMRGGAIERDWARELFEISKGEDGKPGVTGNAQALAIAKIVSRFQETAKQDMNRAGAAITDYSGYITRTSHDASKVYAAGFAAWSKDILPKLDPRTFDGVDDPAKFLKGVWSGLSTGIHLTEDGEAASWKDYGAFTGAGNMAARLSEGRVLHFRDADSWLDYNAQYGIGSVQDAVTNGLNRAAQSTALMKRWGTNPRAEFLADLKHFAESLRDTNPEAAKRFSDKSDSLLTNFNWLDGTNSRPVNYLGAKIGSAMRLVESTAKLGLVAATHLGSMASKAGELRYHGVGLLQGYTDGLVLLVRGRGRTPETQHMMDLLLAGTEGMQRDILSRFDPDDTLPGTLSKGANLFFKLSGLTYLLNAQKSGASFVISRHLGSLLETAHGDLSPQTQRLLSLYRLDPEDWEMLRSAPNHPEINGRQFLTPGAATRIDPATVEAHLRSVGGVLGPDASAARIGDQVGAYQQDLGLRVHAMFHDIAERSVVSPGIYEKSLFLGNNRGGTPIGEALRFMAQFKQWGAAYVRQTYGRELLGNPGDKLGMVGGVVHAMVSATVVGSAIVAIKDLMKGNVPRDPSKPSTWGNAFLQGGGASIAGDFLVGNFSRFGQDASQTLLGPVLGTGIAGLLDLWDKAKAGDAHIAPDALTQALDNTPFINVLGLRTALQYLFLNQVQEWLSPGFMARHNAFLAKQGQRSYLPPASVH